MVVGVFALAVTTGTSLLAAERSIMEPRVPVERLAEARALRSPLHDSPETIEKGKAIYMGRGACVNCHGTSGRGDGVAAVGLDPSPRDFHHHGFWRHRTEGEIFWVIKNGSSGTAMVSFREVLSDEEIWTVIEYLRTFAEEQGPHGDMGPGGRHGRMEGMGHGGAGGTECCRTPEDR
jgi:mono/diheme cytochrome c family protein